MRVHIVGAGPTGMSIAWETLNTTNHEIIIYDRKKSAGGSWWEPSLKERDLHAHRIVFDNAFVNTDNLFKEMGIQWDDFFEKVDSKLYSILFKYLKSKDYITLLSLSFRVLTQPSKYKSITLKDALGDLSETGKKLIQAFPLVMDGVTWDKMSAYEFVKSFDHVAISKQYTQKVSGKVMCDAMQKALEERGVKFVFKTELESVEYGKDQYLAKLSNGDILNDGILVMCIDNNKAIDLIGDNWGKDARDKIKESAYECINILLDYDQEIQLNKPDIEYIMETEYNIQPVVLSDKKTVSCVMCNLTEEILSTEPETLKVRVLSQLDLPKPKNIRIAWGSSWKDGKWVFEQSSGVLGLKGQIPFYGECSKVALCGMMSERNTPFASLESAVEVGRSFCHKEYGSRKPKQLLLTSHILFILIVLVLVLIYIRLNVVFS